MSEKKKKQAKSVPKMIPRALITLLNRGKTKLTLILYHQQVCMKGGKCFSLI